jgi:hypothetical protein
LKRPLTLAEGFTVQLPGLIICIEVIVPREVAEVDPGAVAEEHAREVPPIVISPPADVVKNFPA